MSSTSVRLLVTRCALGPLIYYAAKFPNGRVAARFLILVVFVPGVGGVSASVQIGGGFEVSVNFIA
jgi:hypothetical protein